MINYQSISKQHSPSAITQKVKLHQINSCKILLLLVRHLFIKIKFPFKSFILFWQYNIIFKLNSNQQNFLFLFFNWRIMALQSRVSFCCSSTSTGSKYTDISSLLFLPTPHPPPQNFIRLKQSHGIFGFLPHCTFLASPLCIRLPLEYPRIKTETQAWRVQLFDSFSSIY